MSSGPELRHLLSRLTLFDNVHHQNTSLESSQISSFISRCSSGKNTPARLLRFFAPLTFSLTHFFSLPIKEWNVEWRSESLVTLTHPDYFWFNLCNCFEPPDLVFPNLPLNEHLERVRFEPFFRGMSGGTPASAYGFIWTFLFFCPNVFSPARVSPLSDIFYLTCLLRHCFHFVPLPDVYFLPCWLVVFLIPMSAGFPLTLLLVTNFL